MLNKKYDSNYCSKAIIYIKVTNYRQKQKNHYTSNLF